MPRELHADLIAALEGNDMRWVALIDIELDGVTFRLCTRFNEFDFGGYTYHGIGQVCEIGEVEETMALDPTSCYLRLSGVDTTFLSTIANSDLLNRKVTIRYAAIEGDRSVIGEPFLYFSGNMDKPDIVFGSTSSIEFEIRGPLADWDRHSPQRLTYEDQLSRYPGDRGLEFVATIGSKEIIWPDKGFRES